MENDRNHATAGGATPESAYDRLVAYLKHLSDVQSCRNVLDWDAETAMPAAGAEARGRQTAIISQLAHETLTSPEALRLIEAAEREVASLDADADASHMIRLARYDYDRATKLPAEFVAELTRVTSVAQHVWAQARSNNDFAAFRPHLEKVLELTRRKSDYYGSETYDELLHEFEPTMNTAQVRAIFADLKQRLIPLIKHVAANAQAVDTSCLNHGFSPQIQAVFSRNLAVALGLDPQRARLDVTAHPQTNGMASPFDVRISTRYSSRAITESIFGTAHETGHALYELGLSPEFAGTPLGTAGSMSIHESQSRMWENFVGRSWEFWHYWYPRLQKSFPRQLGGVPMEAFYRAIHKAGPSFIRTEADELTYSLHVILRFELEQDLFSGRLTVAQLPEAWKDRFEQMFGIRPPTDKEGVLQDGHWSGGMFGYFPSYVLGNLLQAQLSEKVLSDHPDLLSQFAEGEYGTLREWLRVNVHRHGRKYGIDKLARRVTGSNLSADAFVRYLDAKYGGYIYPGFHRQ